VDPNAVSLMVQAVRRICGALGLVEDEEQRTDSKGPFRRGVTDRVEASGLLVPLVAPGVAFERGQVLAEVRDISGEIRDRVRANHPGVVVSWAEGAWVARGATVGTLAWEDR